MCEAHVHANADMNMYTHANPHHSNTHAHNNVTQQVICDDFATWSTLTHKWTQFKHMHCWRQGETSPPRTKREIQIWTDTRSFRQVCRPSCRRGTMRGASRTSRAVAKGRWRTFLWKWNLCTVYCIFSEISFATLCKNSAYSNPHHTNTHAYNNMMRQATFVVFVIDQHSHVQKGTQFTHTHCWLQGEMSPPRTKRKIQVQTDIFSFRQFCTLYFWCKYATASAGARTVQNSKGMRK